MIGSLLHPCFIFAWRQKGVKGYCVNALIGTTNGLFITNDMPYLLSSIINRYWHFQLMNPAMMKSEYQDYFIELNLAS